MNKEPQIDFYKLKARLTAERGYNVTWLILAAELGVSVQTIFRWRDNVYAIPAAMEKLINLTYGVE